MTDFKAGADLGSAVRITSTRGAFGTDLNKKETTPPKKKKKDFKAGAELINTVK